jgi:hypothetical protein
MYKNPRGACSMRIPRSILIICGLLLIVGIFNIIKVKLNNERFLPQTYTSDKTVDSELRHLKIPGIYGGTGQSEDVGFSFIMPTGEPIKINSKRSDVFGVNPDKFPVSISFISSTKVSYPTPKPIFTLGNILNGMARSNWVYSHVYGLLKMGPPLETDKDPFTEYYGSESYGNPIGRNSIALRCSSITMGPIDPDRGAVCTGHIEWGALQLVGDIHIHQNDIPYVFQIMRKSEDLLQSWEVK